MCDCVAIFPSARGKFKFIEAPVTFRNTWIIPNEADYFPQTWNILHHPTASSAGWEEDLGFQEKKKKKEELNRFYVFRV